jgi:ABC-type maltose transport system permease subunit
MSGLAMWIVGVIVGIIAVVGLFLSAGSHGGPMYMMGLVIFAAAAAFEFWLIKKYFDQQEGH